RVHRIEDCDAHDRNRATGASWSKLFAESPHFSGSDRSVIESAGVDGDCVPTMNGINRVFWGESGARGLDTVEARAKKITETERTRVVGKGQAERQKDCGR